MRSAGIAIIGLISLIIVFVFVAYVQLILLCLALMICLLVIMGFLRGRAQTGNVLDRHRQKIGSGRFGSSARYAR